MAAAFSDAGDDVAPGVRIEPPGREVVEEEERLGALGEHVVDAHRHQIHAHRVELAGRDGELELGANPVRAGDENRVVEAGGL